MASMKAVLTSAAILATALAQLAPSPSTGAATSVPIGAPTPAPTPDVELFPAPTPSVQATLAPSPGPELAVPPTREINIPPTTVPATPPTPPTKDAIVGSNPLGLLDLTFTVQNVRGESALPQLDIAPVPAPAPALETEECYRNVPQVLRDLAPESTVFFQLLKQFELVDDVRSRQFVGTIFIPTDRAFALLQQTLDPRALDLEFVIAGTVLNHVVPQIIDVDTLSTQTVHSSYLTSILGFSEAETCDDITLTPSSDGTMVAAGSDAASSANIIATAPICGNDNVRVYVIDSVLVPTCRISLLRKIGDLGLVSEEGSNPPPEQLAPAIVFPPVQGPTAAAPTPLSENRGIEDGDLSDSFDAEDSEDGAEDDVDGQRSGVVLAQASSLAAGVALLVALLSML